MKKFSRIVFEDPYYEKEGNLIAITGVTYFLQMGCLIYPTKHGEG